MIRHELRSRTTHAGNTVLAAQVAVERGPLLVALVTARLLAAEGAVDAAVLEHVARELLLAWEGPVAVGQGARQRLIRMRARVDAVVLKPRKVFAAHIADEAVGRCRLGAVRVRYSAALRATCRRGARCARGRTCCRCMTWRWDGRAVGRQGYRSCAVLRHFGRCRAAASVPRRAMTELTLRLHARSLS